MKTFQPLLPAQLQLAASWFRRPELCRRFRIGALSHVAITRRATEGDREFAWMELNDAVAELSRLSFEIECDKHAAPAAQRLCPDVRRHLRVMAESGDSAERAEASNAAASAAVDIIWAMGARSQIPCLWRQFNKATKAYEEARWAVHDACLLNRIRTEFFELLSVAGYAEREAIIQFDQETLGNSFWVGEGNIDCWEMDPLILVPGKEFKHIEALSLNCLVPLLCMGTIANDYGVYQMQMQF